MSNGNRESGEPPWSYPIENPELLKKLVQDLHLHPAIAQVCISRGLETIAEVRSFLYPHLLDLHVADLFPGMRKAVERVLLARQRKERVIIYGDSDVDGITGVAVLVEFLRVIGIHVDYCFLSSIFKQHKDISQWITVMKQKQISLLITVDCGISAAKEVNEMKKVGIDVIVTDHHTPTGRIPNGVAVLNPKLRNHPYPNKELTGVGVAFKLALAIFDTLVAENPSWSKRFPIFSLLDLVSLGTLTDVGTLVGENRILVRCGIQEIVKGNRLGLRKLCTFAGVNWASITSADLVLKIAPKLNSLGRLAEPGKGVELLLTKDHRAADNMIRELDRINRARQKIEGKVFRDVQKILNTQPQVTKQAAIVVSSQNWHSRVIPIISARLAKTYHRPVAIISTQDGVGKGSLRTISSFPLLGVLRKCSSLLQSYGGHDLAAGIILQVEKIEDFRKKFIHLVHSSMKKEPLPPLQLDSCVDFDMIDHELLASMDLFEPFGRGNPSLLFYATVRQTRCPKLFQGNHIKLFLAQKERHLEGVASGLGHRIHALKAFLSSPIEIAYTPKFYHGPGGALCLIVKDFRVIHASNK